MKKYLLMSFVCVLLAAAPLAYAQEREARAERGLFPAIIRWLENENRGGAAPQRNTENASGTADGASPRSEAPATTERGESAPQQPPAEPARENPDTPAATQGISTPGETQPEAGSAEALSPVTTPDMLNIHSATSDMYRAQTPLTRAEAGLLFILSVGLALAGLMLAEQGGLRQLLAGPAPRIQPMSSERTALS